MKKQRSWAQILTGVMFGIFVAQAVFCLVQIIRELVSPGSSGRLLSDYSFSFAQCILGILAMLLPGFLERKVQISIPSEMLFIYAAFLFAAFYLGESRGFYHRIPHWDTILHTLTGAALAALGFSLVQLLNGAKRAGVKVGPGFAAVFAFCFALALGALWEIGEFVVDVVLGSNAQRFLAWDGTPLVGQEALVDTMKDLIVDSVGALVMVVVGFFAIRDESDWPKWMRIEMSRKKT